MRIGDYFSGIGGFSIAAERVFGPGCIAYHCEKDAFARKILNKHWPNVPCHEDITQTDPATLPHVDAVVGGWPCQGNSSAGKRKGHGDARSGLFSELLRHVDGMAQKPAWVFFENVPGLVSVNGWRDFAEVILQLQRRGYVGCVRCLDAQYDGLAQRRARLLFVGGLGRTGVRAVQLITEGGKRYPAPRREKGQEVAGTLGAGTHPGSYSGQDAYNDLLIAHTLTGNGFDASEDGTGRGTPLVAYQCHGGNVGPMGVLRAGNGNAGGGVPFIAGTLQASGAGTARPAGMVSETDFLIARCGTAGEGSRQDGESCTFVAFGGNGCGQDAGPVCPTLRPGGVGGGGGHVAITEIITGRGRGLDDGCANNVQATGNGVRRLTPTECSRLQGFPDGWCCICGAADEYREVLRLVWEAACAEGLSFWTARELLSLSTQRVLRLHLRETPPGGARRGETDFWQAARTETLSHVEDCLRTLRNDKPQDRQASSGRKHAEQRSGEHRVPLRFVPHQRPLVGGEFRREDCRTEDAGEQPDYWKTHLLEGMSLGICGCSDGPQYRVLGNAAPPPMLEWIFRQIAAAEGA